MLRDYTPDMALDLHEGDSEDLPILTSRHLNVYEPLAREGKEGLVEGWMYDTAAQSGWWHGPYHTGGDSNEGILRNTFGLKNILGMLGENRASGGNTRPAEGSQLANRNRKSYGSLWEEFNTLEYYWTNLAKIRGIVQDSIAYQSANVGRIVFRGSYPWGLHARFPVHDLPDFDDDPADDLTSPLPNQSTNMNTRNTDYVNPSRILEVAPCGYFVTEPQYSGPAPGIGPPLSVRLDAHGIAQQTRPSGHIVRLAQPLRGLIPMLLDASTLPPIEPPAPVGAIVHGIRLFECPHITAAERSYSKTLLEGQTTSDTLAIGNIAPEVDEPLNWTITEAVSDCATPSDLPWISTGATSGSVASAGGAQNVSVNFNTAGIGGNSSVAGVLCLASNDAGEALITIPVSLAIRSLRADIAAVRAALASHSPLPVTHANKALIAALAALDRALEASNWDDGVRPGAAGGRTVFDTLVRAVKELNKIGEPWSQSAVDSLVATGREIAAVAIGEAAAGPNKDKAIKELQRGDQMVNAEPKLESYRRAWAWVREGPTDVS